MEPSFTVKVDITELGGERELLITPKSRYFDIESSDQKLCSISKLKGDTWIQIDGTLSNTVIEEIGCAIEASLEHSI